MAKAVHIAPPALALIDSRASTLPRSPALAEAPAPWRDPRSSRGPPIHI
jgi:hypothetical protein